MRTPGRRIPTLCIGLILAAGPTASAFAQQGSAVCCARFDYVLERTIFKVDAVRLELTVGGETPGRVAELVSGMADPRSASDSAAALYLKADHARVGFTFLRSFGLKRFLDANLDVMEKLSKTGLLSDAEVQKLSAENADRFRVLAADGIRDGDRLEHEVRGDTVTTRYTDVTGAVRLDEVRIGPEQRRVLLGSLFGPQSGFRKGLLDQVFSEPY